MSGKSSMPEFSKFPEPSELAVVVGGTVVVTRKPSIVCEVLISTLGITSRKIPSPCWIEKSTFCSSSSPRVSPARSSKFEKSGRRRPKELLKAEFES